MTQRSFGELRSPLDDDSPIRPCIRRVLG